jgi:hypothetical protein
MPIGWIGFSVATSQNITGKTPAELRAFVEEVVGNIEPDASFVELYFDVVAERAYALVIDLDDYKKLKAVMRILGADEYTKLLNPDQVTEAYDMIPGQWRQAEST